MELIYGFRPDTEVECAFMREKLRLMRNPKKPWSREIDLGKEVVKKRPSADYQQQLVEAAQRVRQELIKEVEDYNKMPLAKVVKMVRAWRDPKKLAGVYSRKK